MHRNFCDPGGGRLYPECRCSPTEGHNHPRAPTDGRTPCFNLETDP